MSSACIDHVSRHWPGTGFAIEDECPCPQESCGCVDTAKFHPLCTEHTMFKTMRQGHSADRCPGTRPAPSVETGGER